MTEEKNTVLVTANGELNDLPVSLQLYQAIYNDITGKTEKITDTYGRYFDLTLNDIANLGQRINQFCEQFHIQDQSAAITIFHIKGSKERFSSFERLNTYNTGNTSPIERILIEINFLIVLPRAQRPQCYTVKITLASGIAILEKHKDQIPFGIPPHVLVRTVQKDTAVIATEYVDYMVARGMSELFREWLSSLPEKPTSKALEWFQSVSHIIRQFVTLIFFLEEAILLCATRIIFSVAATHLQLS